jgi:hypothetical protein
MPRWAPAPTQLFLNAKYAMFGFPEGSMMPIEYGSFDHLWDCCRLFYAVEVAALPAGHRLTIFRGGVCPDPKDAINQSGGRWVASQVPVSRPVRGSGSDGGGCRTP